jgi:hypothetical protein
MGCDGNMDRLEARAPGPRMLRPPGAPAPCVPRSARRHHMLAGARHVLRLLTNLIRCRQSACPLIVAPCFNSSVHHQAA